MMKDTIAALATARGVSALAIVRISGPLAIAIVEQVFRPRTALAQLATRACAVGHIATATERVDQVVVTLFRAPHSYTGEDVIEITTHGGLVVPPRVLELLCQRGARPADPGEFTQRAFLNGKVDLAQAEAVEALIAAKSAVAAQAAMRVLAGGLRRSLEPCLDRLASILTTLEASLDVQEDGAPDSTSLNAGDTAGVLRVLLEEGEGLQRMLESARAGAQFEQGLRVVFAGRPNAGKSSLFNALLARERAIVSSEPGTTRDYLEGCVEWEGSPIVLIDTAGIAEARTLIEQECVRRSREAVASAALVVQVVDVSATEPGDAAGDVERLRAVPERRVVALHKWDLPRHRAWDALLMQDPPNRGVWRDVRFVPSSTVSEPGVASLRSEIVRLARSQTGEGAGACMVGQRQRQLLVDAVESIARAAEGLRAGDGVELAACELRSALDRMGEILGRRVGPMVIEQIFSRFCVGK